MKIGIIIVFYNNERDIDSNLFNGLSSIKNHLQLCLVNNGSEDATLENLEALKDTSGLHSAIIDIKQNKGEDAAIKAGARYLFNQNKLKHIAYVNVDKLKAIHDLHTLLNLIEMNKESIIQHNLNAMQTRQIKRLIFKNVFCILEYLNKLEIKLSYAELNVIHN
ncbi:hypothetical protein GCM10023311_04160 [Flaviramulus aquimarinus]|uniref:Glycosyltransferase 2-like domain-containing protein n=1 Tax=Flaviramulus aquimarinus TaxID=1170456 RepID=A0ABP9ETG3_9FLAO